MQNKKRILGLVSIFFLIAVASQSCSKETSEESNPDSSGNGQKSHNMGQNCMNCHKNGGQGEGTFLLAGTIYKGQSSTVQPNGTVKLYTGPNGTGTLKTSLSVDGNGNFYTTGNVDFSGGLYPIVIGTSGNVQQMGFSVTNGQCNSCHGSSTAKIYVN